MEKQFLKGLVESINKEDGTLSVAVATDATIDRDGEVVDPKGLDFTNFLKNPVLLYAHDYRSDPIGKVIKIALDGSRVLFTPQFAIDINPKAKMYFEMFKQGILNAFSIGFIPKEYMDRQNGDGSTNRVFTKSELLEISAVPVPANPQALVLVRTMKMEDGSAIDEQIISELEKHAKEAPVDTPAPTPSPAPVPSAPAPEEVKCSECGKAADAAPEFQSEDHKICKECLAKGWKELGIKVIELEEVVKSLADNRENKEVGAPSVDELLRNPLFTRDALKSIDIAVGKVLRDLNRGKRDR